MRKKNNGPPASPDSATFQQLWEALGSRLEESAREHLLYTQGVSCSDPAASRKYKFGGCKQFDILVVKA